MKYLLFAFSAILLDMVGSCRRDNYNLDVDPQTIEFDYRCSERKIIVSSNTNWAISTKVSWLEIYPQSGYGDEVIRVVAQPNESTYDRSGIIRVYVVGRNVQREIRIYQEGKPFVDNNKDGA